MNSITEAIANMSNLSWCGRIGLGVVALAALGFFTMNAINAIREMLRERRGEPFGGPR